MFVARVALRTTPAGYDTVLSDLLAQATAVPDLFEACERFDVSVCPDADHEIRIIEEWTDRASAEQYLESEHIADLRSRIVPLLAASPDSAYYDATRIGP